MSFKKLLLNLKQNLLNIKTPQSTHYNVNVEIFIPSSFLSCSLNIIRMLNKKLINIERAFILPEGLPGRPYFK